MSGMWQGVVVVVAAVAVVGCEAWPQWLTWNTEENLCKDVCRCPDDFLLAQQKGIDCVGQNISYIQDGLSIPKAYRSIDFSRNHIKSLSADTFEPSTTLINLDLSDNELVDLPARVFKPLQVLSSLILNNNKISSVDIEAFAGLQNLTKLDISYNKIKSLFKGVFENLIHLEVLNLGFNPIKVFNESLLEHCRDLKILDLSKLNIRTIHASFFPANLTKLEELSLAYNHLSVVPSKALKRLSSSLQHLDLSGNPIQHLGAYSFDGLTNLRSLVLEQMLKLRTINAYAFADLNHLDTLIMCYMPWIKTIDPKAFHNAPDNGTESSIVLADFTFSFSSLATLPETLLPWDSLRFAQLEYNHWRCDCNMKWVKNSSLLNMLGSRMICSQPAHLRGFSIKNLKEEELTCRVDQIETKGAFGFLALVMVAGLSASLATVSLLVYWRRGWVCSRPQGAYTSIQRGESSITITDEELDRVSSEA